MKHFGQKFRIISILLIFLVGFCPYLNLGYIYNTNTNIYSFDDKLSNLKTSGTYENITIDTLRWNNWTWAETQEWCSGIGTLENPYIIQGHALGIDNFKDGIKINNSQDVYFIIQECTLFWDGSPHLFEVGISILNSTKGTIINNTIHGIYYGIYIDECEQINIVNNRIYSTTTGIAIYNSESCSMDENTISQTGLHGIYLSDSEQNTIKNNVVYDCDYGIYLSNSDDNEVFGNTADDNDIAGIKLRFSNFNNITDNDSMGNLDGIHIEEECDNNSVVNNDFSNNNIGIEMYYSDLNHIIGNIMNNNDYYGLRLEVCENNTVTGNVVKNNTQYGMYIEMESHNNSFRENYFLQNGVHAWNEGLDNDWNSTTIGNYWDNHTGPDVSPQDGIVDVPYTYFAGGIVTIDFLPIAEDGVPQITFDSPSGGSSFGNNAPTIMVRVVDSTPVEMWYTLDGGIHNYTFYYVLYHTFTYTGYAGNVNQAAWDAIPDGSVTILFYAEDIAGNLAFKQISIVKNTFEGLDPGMITLIVVISVVGGLAILSTAFFYLRKRRGST